MALRERKFIPNQSIVKVYGSGANRKIKVIHFKLLRNSGIEADDEIRTPQGSVNDHKTMDNISRARSKIFELAYCNEWEYFFTGTLDPSKYDRENLETYHKDFTRWLRNFRRHAGCSELQFLIVPELHADGKSWHTHGFIKGLPSEYLHQFQIGDKMSKYIVSQVRKGETLYNWPAYAQKFGFCDLEPIKNKEAVSKYVTKYMSKSLYDTCLSVGAHLYYHSRGLNTAEVYAQGFQTANLDDLKIDYENDFCKVSWLTYSDELLQRLINSVGNVYFD